MNKTTCRIRLMLIITAAITVALGIFSAVAHLRFFEADIFMFATEGQAVMRIYYVLCALCVLLTVSYCYAEKKNSSDDPLPKPETEKENVAACALRICGGSIFLIGAALRISALSTNKVTYALPREIIAPMLLMLLASSFYFFPELSKKLGRPNLSSICGILGSIAFIIDILAIYADMTQPIASEYKLMTAVYTIIFLLFWVTELRLTLSEPRPYAYIALLVIGCAVGGSICIGRAALLLTGGLPIGNELARAFCGFGFTVYLFSRLISMITNSTERTI